MQCEKVSKGDKEFISARYLPWKIRVFIKRTLLTGIHTVIKLPKRKSSLV